MVCPEIISGIKGKVPDFTAVSVSEGHPDQLCIEVSLGVFRDTCIALHNLLSSPVMMLFAVDERRTTNKFRIRCVFLRAKRPQWVTVRSDIAGEAPCFESLAKSVHSASLFEREIWEMFGIEPKGSPDLRRLNLHDEVWPEGAYPLRKDFKGPSGIAANEYKFVRVDGDGVFEVPVGPVHAGIIGPGHFRFSAAGEPIINLETRLGFTHRGVEKLFEGRPADEAIKIAERVSGDSSFAHSLALARALEKIYGAKPDLQSEYARAVFLELERMYNHINDMGGMAVDVGFSFPAAFASIIKEAILRLNELLAGSRYLKGINTAGGILISIGEDKIAMLKKSLAAIEKDFDELSKMLNSSVSFMDRVDTTGVLRRKTAEDLGVLGLAGRASGIARDLREIFPGVYEEPKFKIAVERSGDCLARLKVRMSEFSESCRLVGYFAGRIGPAGTGHPRALPGQGEAMGYSEGWRGPVLYWVKTDVGGAIERCKIVDPSFHNWQALSYAVLGDIIPDFPLCNKSFDLSYSGNDL